MLKKIFIKGYRKGVEFNLENFLKEIPEFECTIKESAVLKDSKTKELYEAVIVEIIFEKED